MGEVVRESSLDVFESIGRLGKGDGGFGVF